MLVQACSVVDSKPSEERVTLWVDALAIPSADLGAPVGNLTLTIVDCAALVKGVARFSPTAPMAVSSVVVFNCFVMDPWAARRWLLLRSKG
jgi:hypothetical protein